MFAPVPLNLPPYNLRLKKESGKVYVFDPLRKKYLVLSPEEWVRQHWIEHLSAAKGYPKALMQCEGGLILNDLRKRSDLVIFNAQGAKVLLAEFKAPNIKITQETFDQISRYNIIHRIPLLLVSNGLNHFYCKIDFDQGSYTFLEDLPAYSI